MLQCIDETDDRFQLGESTLPGAGRGVFARVPLAAGEELLVVGVVVNPGSVADECSRFADTHKLRMGDQLIVPLGYAGMVNHSSRNPNMERVVRAGAMYLRALRPISAGEELFITYHEYARARWHLDD
jgi:hypothetical protein